MQADDHPVEVILKEARRFMVPLYQRKYQWADERIFPFWEDVEVKASEVLEGEGKFQHYMGALILSPVGEAAQIAVTPKVQVVDGQQRLTTFQLFLAALREIARQHNCDALIKHVAVYLFNELKSKGKDPLTRFKLTPTPSDRGVFHDIIDKEYQFVRLKYTRYYWGHSVPKNTPFRALRAYEVFRQKIEHFANYGSTNAVEEDDETVLQDETDTAAAIETRLEALLTALLVRMKLVVIMLDEGDDAQVIFETLNSKSEPLLAMDLVRNNIFHRAEKEDASIDELYRELWDPFDDPWWRNPAPSARPAALGSTTFSPMPSLLKPEREFRCVSSMPSTAPSPYPEVGRALKVWKRNSGCFSIMRPSMRPLRDERRSTRLWLGSDPSSRRGK